MLFATFKLLDVRKQANFPPFIVKIDKRLLDTKVQELKKQIHEHFKPYISPFITDQNLRLSCKQTQSMINSIPLYMYIDCSHSIQYIQCTTQPKDADNEQKWKFIKNMLIYKVSNNSNLASISQKDLKAIENVIAQKKSHNQETEIIVNGQILQKNCDQNWGKFVQEHWKQWALQNECIYVNFINRQPQNSIEKMSF